MKDARRKCAIDSGDLEDILEVLEFSRTSRGDQRHLANRARRQ